MTKKAYKAYKARTAGTDKTDWIIAVIYDVDAWPPRSLRHKGFNDYQFKIAMTDIENNDFQTNGTRLSFTTYRCIHDFLEDEELCGVDREFSENVIKHYTDSIYNMHK